MASSFSDQYYYPDYFFSKDILDLPPTPSTEDSCGCSRMPRAALLGAALSDNYEGRGLSSSNAAINLGFAGDCEVLGEECTGVLDSNFWPAVYPMTGVVNWEEMQGGGNGMVEESSASKITRYSAEERKDRILRYIKKRSQRNFTKTIKYGCRKTLADKRVRVRGRFAKNNELSNADDQMQQLLLNNDHRINLQEESKESWYQNTTSHDPLLFQMKPPHGEEWLQDISSLMYYHVRPDSEMEVPDKYLGYDNL